jgi:hypothetical protein
VRVRARTSCLLASAFGLAIGSALADAPLADAERAFIAFRDADDRARLAPSPRHERRRDARAARSLAILDRVDASLLGEEDRRAADIMRRALSPEVERDQAFTRSVYEAFGRAAETIRFEGETLDRLTILGRLAAEPDEGRRQRLFMALQPVWWSLAGTSPEDSPYRELIRRRRDAWSRRTDGSPFDSKAREWGLTPEELESWLTRVLTAWRDAYVGGPPIEPWDWYYANGAADRQLAARLPLATMIQTAFRYDDDLGASPKRLGVKVELKPRRGKDPVAFTDFKRHGRYENGEWRRGEFVVSASYRNGGLGNLYELMHEMGHAVHIAAIRARPAYCDWPDSDVLTEALADLLGVEAYEPAWQRRYLGAEAAPSRAMRARLAGTILDFAWALLELRAHRNPSADPSALWAEITSGYLGIAPHPELPWWALRGQLIDAPGYLANYALGAILTEALRARVRDLRGADAFETPSPELYGWLSDRLYRFGLEKPSRELVKEFLGEALTLAPFLGAISSGRKGP